jgi:hypothetical protein
MSSTAKRRKAQKQAAQRRKQVLIKKLTGDDSCRGCQYLYLQDYGYSNYTTEGATLNCALDKNPAIGSGGLEIDTWDWLDDERLGIRDRCPQTAHGMCQHYIALPEGETPMRFDVDCEVRADAITGNFHPLVRKALAKHSGR